jgi:hypothetical protein
MRHRVCLSRPEAVNGSTVSFSHAVRSRWAPAAALPATSLNSSVADAPSRAAWASR